MPSTRPQVRQRAGIAHNTPYIAILFDIGDVAEMTLGAQKRDVGSNLVDVFVACLHPQAECGGGQVASRLFTSQP